MKTVGAGLRARSRHRLPHREHVPGGQHGDRDALVEEFDPEDLVGVSQVDLRRNQETSRL
jgi:hypothetical protein